MSLSRRAGASAPLAFALIKARRAVALAAEPMKISSSARRYDTKSKRRLEDLALGNVSGELRH